MRKFVIGSMVSMWLMVGCSPVTINKVEYPVKDRICLSKMEWAMRHVDPFVLRGVIPPYDVAVEWTNVKYECWKEGTTD
jgi:hypothetical protein